MSHEKDCLNPKDDGERKELFVKDSDDFFQYVKVLYLNEEFNPTACVEYPERKDFRKFICYLHRCEFLNKIPKDEWDTNILKIFSWAKRYFRKPIFDKKHNKSRPVEERNSHIKALKEAEKAIEIFLPKETSRTTCNKTEYIDFEGTPYQDMFFIQDLHRKLNKAIEDIEKKKFKIFPREHYEGSKASEHEALERILRGIANKYNISPYSDDIKHLKSMLKY